MQGLGQRLRTRARELGLSDAEVARRAGLGQTRYAGYVTDRHEPDLTTFQRICAVLGMPAADLLGNTVLDDDGTEALRARILAGARALDKRSLEVAVVVMDGLIARLNHTSSTSGDDVVEGGPVSPVPEA